MYIRDKWSLILWLIIKNAGKAEVFNNKLPTSEGRDSYYKYDEL